MIHTQQKIFNRGTLTIIPFVTKTSRMYATILLLQKSPIHKELPIRIIAMKFTIIKISIIGKLLRCQNHCHQGQPWRKLVSKAKGTIRYIERDSFCKIIIISYWIILKISIYSFECNSNRALVQTIFTAFKYFFLKIQFVFYLYCTYIVNYCVRFPTVVISWFQKYISKVFFCVVNDLY